MILQGILVTEWFYRNLDIHTVFAKMDFIFFSLSHIQYIKKIFSDLYKCHTKTLSPPFSKV